MNEWRSEPITDKQIERIIKMQEADSLPVFRGGTRGEAADYIEAYTKGDNHELPRFILRHD